MVRHPDDLVAYDVTCGYCDHPDTDVGGPNTRILWLPNDYEPGDTINHVHSGNGGCGLYGRQIIKGKLPTLTHPEAHSAV